MDAHRRCFLVGRFIEELRLISDLNDDELLKEFEAIISDYIEIL